MNKFFSSIKAFLAPKNQDDTIRNENDDYTIKKGKRFDIVIRIISIVGAVIVWLIAVTSNQAIAKREISSVKIDTVGYSEFVKSAAKKGFIVDFDTSVTETFTISGRKKFVNSLQNEEISVTADFSKYINALNTLDTEKENTLNIQIEIKIPKYFMLSDIKNEYIEIKLIPEGTFNG